MPATLKLSELAIGTTAVVRELPKTGGTVTLRLREMGVLPGTKITLVRAAPLGDPLEIKVRGYNLSLRKSEAVRVIVEVVE